MLEPTFQIFLLHPFLDLLTLADLGMLVVEDHRGIGFIADQVMLKLILIISGDDLLIDGFGKLCLVLLALF